MEVNQDVKVLQLSRDLSQYLARGSQKLLLQKVATKIMRSRSDRA